MKADEQVFCLKRTDLETYLHSPLPQGMFAGIQLGELLNLPQHFVPRSLAESDPSCKQLIPYQLFCRGTRFFVYERGKRVGENRLAGRLSLGIGGHINSSDAPTGKMTEELYYEALQRERREELVCPEVLGAAFLGLINDDSDPVGQVHLGTVHRCQVRPDETLAIRPASEDLHPHGWWTAEEIIAERDRFEKWSLLALELALHESREL